MEKLSEEVKLFEDMVEFMERVYISNKQVTIDDRKALSVARDNVNDVHREMSAVILSSSLAIDVSLIVKDYTLKVGKELNDICNKVSNLTIKVNVKDYVDSIQLRSHAEISVIDVCLSVKESVRSRRLALTRPHDYDFCIDDDDDDDFGEINPYLEKKKKLILESDDYEQTLLFLDKLKEIAGQEQVSSKDLGILFHTYNMITEVYCGLYKIIDSAESSSVWDIDMSLTINESRTKVQNELNYICNNMTNHTIKEAISHHLVGYKAGNRPTKLLPRVNFLTSNSISVLLLLCVLIDIARFLQRGKECQANQMETTNKKSKLGSGDDVQHDFTVDDSSEHDCNFRNDDDDDDGDFGENNVYLEENKKLNLEAEDYKETIMFMDKLMILNVYADLCLIIDSDASWDNKDATLRIKESRSMVENELSYICNNVSNLTIKEAYSQHLDRKRVLSQSEMRKTEKKSKLCSGEQNFLRGFDPFADWDLECTRKGNEIQHASTTDDSSEDDSFAHWDPKRVLICFPNDYIVDDSSSKDIPYAAGYGGEECVCAFARKRSC
ncbi:14-3-3-like protein, partial [Tanacetum coccineum]